MSSDGGDRYLCARLEQLRVRVVGRVVEEVEDSTEELLASAEEDCTEYDPGRVCLRNGFCRTSCRVGRRRGRTRAARTGARGRSRPADGRGRVRMAT